MMKDTFNAFIYNRGALMFFHHIMEVVQQDKTLPIENLDFLNGDLDSSMVGKHGKLLPNSFRAIICGPSGCGKTNAILTLLFHPNGAKFENIYVYSKSLYQPKYQVVQEILGKVKGLGYYPFRENEEIISPHEAKSNSIFIFDDVACDGQQKIREYYSFCRHRNIDAAYLCQTYSKIPKQLIRDNCNMIVLFKQDEMNLKHVFDEHVSPDMTFEEFKEMCAECWRQHRYGTVVIMKDFDINAGRYRQGFDKYISIQRD